MAERKKTPAKSQGSKETLYVDVDDEITSIIDKVKGSDKKIVALVLPKRTAVLQSVVNMKLLKKAGKSASKSIVLITSETALLPLAGAAGLHVAKSLQSKPEIPPAPRAAAEEDTVETVDDSDPELDKSASVGALAAVKAEEDEVIDLDKVEMDDLPAPSAKSKKPKKIRQLKVPNFERFKLSVILGILALCLLIFGWIWATRIAPKAVITIKSDTETVVSSFDFTVSTDQETVDLDGYKIPAHLKEVEKKDEEKVKATGERDDGTKASGTVRIVASCVSNSITVSGGTVVTHDGLNYRTSETVTVDTPHGGGPGTWTCRADVDIASIDNGDKFNLEEGQDFTVAGYSSASATNTTAITGGTSKIVKIVSEKDVDDAVTKINERQVDALKEELKTTLESDGLVALVETLVVEGEPKIKASPAVGKEGDNTTVTWQATYTMLGVNREDLKALITKDISDEIDPERQAISDDGIDQAIIRVNNNNEPGTAFLNFRASVIAGPQIDQQAVKEAIKGMKRGEVEKYIGDLPGVNEVIVEYSPMWVFQTPKNVNKITLVIEESDQ